MARVPVGVSIAALYRCEGLLEGCSNRTWLHVPELSIARLEGLARAFRDSDGGTALGEVSLEGFGNVEALYDPRIDRPMLNMATGIRRDEEQEGRYIMAATRRFSDCWVQLAWHER